MIDKAELIKEALRSVSPSKSAAPRTAIEMSDGMSDMVTRLRAESIAGLQAALNRRDETIDDLRSQLSKITLDKEAHLQRAREAERKVLELKEQLDKDRALMSTLADLFMPYAGHGSTISKKEEEIKAIKSALGRVC